MTFETHHVCIKVTDMERSRTFYEQALGFAVETVIHHTPTITSCFLAAPDRAMQIQLLNFPNITADHTGYGHLGMKVADIQESYAYHQKMGVISQGIVEQPHQWGYFIKAPDGYETELCQLKK